MAHTQFLCRFDEMTPGTARRFDIEQHAIAVVRIGDDFYAIGDTCSHAEVSLSEGEVLEEEKQLECWRHGSAFSLVDGTPHALPATKPVPVYTISVIDGNVMVELP